MITREDLVEQSVQDYVRHALFDLRDTPEDQVEILDAFPFNRFEGQLERNYVAMGFNFDDGGTQAELGSDLKVRLYTLQFFVFGLTPVLARNLANQIKFAADSEGVIPLKDIAQAGGPVIDALVVLSASAERQIIPSPEPWQENVWTSTVRVEDTYHALLV